MDINEVSRPIDGLDITGMIVVLRKEALDPVFYRDRRFLAMHGFGCIHGLRGTAVFGRLINPPTHGRAERFEIEGIAKHGEEGISNSERQKASLPENGGS